MRGGRVVAAVVVMGSVAAPGAAHADWHELSGGSLRAGAAGDARETVAAVSGGAPYVAWSEGAGQATDIRVARLDRDGAFRAVGSPDRTAGSWSIEPALADVGGVLHVAWAERGPLSSDRFQVHVARLVDGAFVPVGTTPNRSTAADGRDPVLADVGGVAHVLWVEGDTQSLDIRAARFTGSAWEATGAIDHSTRAAEAAAGNPLSLVTPVTRVNAGDPAAAVIGGVLHAAWAEGGEVYAARLDGPAWTELGSGPANGPEGDGASQTAIADAGGTPLVAWRAADGAFSVRAARLDGGAWVPAGAPIASAGDPGLTSIDGTPWLTWVRSGELRAARLSAGGTAWEQPVDAALNVAGGATAADPGILPIGGVPYVAWAEGYAGGRKDARVARLEPDVLASRVTGVSATGATLVATFDTHGLAYPVSAAYGPAGSPLAARTAMATASGSADEVLLTIGGLQPRTAYETQALAAAGAGADVAGPVVGFTTAKRNGK